ncbi:phage gp6-like head-tail connector protein [Duganella sp. CY15W]|uniref:head-tail connector protein n=1 Tax=Duganella sp. CY15W TaxID=2692172 RepID=UPI00136AC259|nr:head-tail connector protein [Duganella sp. CY15W]MYM31489.1 phage gp6-like head-tail connector protein [Duganella sp. CY15W]
MSLISMDVAKSHLRVVGSDEDADIELKLQAAEQAASAYLNRNLYVDQAALNAALESAPGAFAAACEAHRTAIDAANALSDDAQRGMALLGAHERFDAANLASILIYRGMVANSAIKAAILLTLGHLYENREDAVVGLVITELPAGARSLLRPYRIGVGL